MQCLQSLDMSAAHLQTLVRHLPTAEIASHWEVLRG
jgi:hypothetical protein